ncbi:MAG: tetratricopeptide repeat protein, partial [Bacteroidota bacterium]
MADQNPNHPMPLLDIMQQGQTAYEQAQFEEAFRLYSQAIHMVEDQDAEDQLAGIEAGEIYAMRASSLVAQDQDAALTDADIFNQAIDDYDQAIERSPRNVLFLNLRGEMYLRCGFAEYAPEAMDDFQLAVEIAPQNAPSLRNLGEANLKLEKFDEALYNLTLAIDNDASDSDSFRLRAMAYLQKPPGNYAAAANDFAQAIKLAPLQADLYQWRAQALQEMGQPHIALEVYQQLIDLAPNVAEYYIDRAVMLIESDPERAMQDLNQALELEPNALAYNNRAYLHYQEGEYDSAILDAKRALDVDPNASIAYATLAEIYAALDDREQFYPYLQLAVDEYYEDIVEVMTFPGFARYQKEERFQQIIKPNQ